MNFPIADQWGMEPLKELCQDKATLWHLENDAHPSRMLPLERLWVDNSVEEIVRVASEAQKTLQKTYEIYLKLTIDRLGKKN